MPCRYYEDHEVISMAHEQANRATRLLCKMVAHFGIVPGDEELAAWKAEHDERDRQRTAGEKAERARKENREHRERIAEQARAKLTSEELEALKVSR